MAEQHDAGNEGDDDSHHPSGASDSNAGDVKRSEREDDEERGDVVPPNTVVGVMAPPPGPDTQPLATNFWGKAWDFIGTKAQSINIGHLLLLLLGLHLFAMTFPQSTGSNQEYVFDEAYYVTSAKDLLALVPNNLEHPFFGKIWGAIGIHLFGDNFFGWRILYVIIGLAAVWALYLLARQFFSKEKALFAASFLGFETLFFIHTSLLLLEGPPILFALLGFLAYFKKHYYLCAVCLALSILSKEWGIYFLAALFLYHIWATKSIPFASLFSRPRLKQLAIFAVILVLVVGLPLWAYDAVYHPYTSSNVVIHTEVIINPQTNVTTTISNTTTSYNYVNYPWQNFAYYYSYHTSLTCDTACAQNKWDHFAWGWILPFNINPSGYYVTTVTVSTKASNGTVISTKTLHPIDWQGIGNLVIWYAIWIIVPVLIAKIVRGKVTPLDTLIGVWIAATYIPSLVLSGFYHRVVYAFYFINVDPALALGIPMVVTYIASDSPKLQRGLLLMWLAAAIIFFILFFPVHPLDFG